MLKEKNEIVHDVLCANSEDWLSLNQLRRKIEEEEGTCMDFRTIVKSIDLLNRLGIKITERVERRGAKKIPVKVFQLNTNNDNTCLD